VQAARCLAVAIQIAARLIREIVESIAENESNVKVRQQDTFGLPMLREFSQKLKCSEWASWHSFFEICL
jgi:hypothetical protein